MWRPSRADELEPQQLDTYHYPRRTWTFVILWFCLTVLSWPWLGLVIKKEVHIQEDKWSEKTPAKKSRKIVENAYFVKNNIDVIGVFSYSADSMNPTYSDIRLLVGVVPKP